MKTSVLCRALQASVFGILTVNVYAQSSTAAALGPISTLDCYKSADTLTRYNTDTFQTDGLCQGTCGNQGYAVMAITGGSTCYCGNELPALDEQVDESKCDSPCNGFGSKTCGGLGYWQVYLTGLTGDVQTAPNSTTSSSSASSSSEAASQTSTGSSTTRPAETVVVTASANTSTHNDSSGPSKVGIAVGVVVGVLALAGIVGGVVFFMRQKKRKEIEEEHKRNAAVSAFVSNSKSSEASSTTDQRLDPSVFSHRRESIGSIADERDFSRRILQVRNPDRASQHSTMA